MRREFHGTLFAVKCTMSFFRKPAVIATLMILAMLGGGAAYAYHLYLTPNYEPLGWSPDGRFLVCNYATNDTSGTVVVLPRSGGREIVLHTNPGSLSCYEASFSPDGRRVAFEHMGLYIIDANGKNERKLEDVVFRGWGTDSSWIVVEANQKLVEQNIETGKRRPFLGHLPKSRSINDVYFSPQPLHNGDMVMNGWDTKHREEIWRVKPKTGRGHLLVRGWYPLVSPKGDCLAYSDNGTIRFLDL